uniref:Uncharacterized protein n=1 Tax=Thermogemmatispora argillosa TaxID=2045280 RepID=A0A455T6N9_9CHLR|nr:hypothetical protein KTA_27740 [Thermogemmatispora argillosa]
MRIKSTIALSKQALGWSGTQVRYQSEVRPSRRMTMRSGPIASVSTWLQGKKSLWSHRTSRLTKSGSKFKVSPPAEGIDVYNKEQLDKKGRKEYKEATPGLLA